MLISENTQFIHQEENAKFTHEAEHTKFICQDGNNALF